MLSLLTEMRPLTAAWLIPLLPLLGAVAVGLGGTRLFRAVSHWPVILGVAGSLVLSGVLWGAVIEMEAPAFETTYTVYDWIAPVAHLWFSVSFRIDPLTVVMLLTVCAVSLLVVIYSRDYMREHRAPERGYERFFAFLGLFVFSMCTLVLAGNFLLLYLGWEAVGLCSYLLIGFYYDRPAAAAAAKKAFLVNRIGDFGFGLGILFLYRWIAPLAQPGENPLDYAVVFRNAAHLDVWQCTTIALLLFCGAVGKSAQLPLYVWLPDAMEGPTPVSALIHAATMVTAGVYMVARCGPIFARSPEALAVVAAIGAVTAFFAATIALAQYDLKRILAYSTVSQLGYMFLGLGACAADSAIFHLFTHAFFKALLFLGAGSVMHALGGTIDVRRFSGLRHVMPVTYATFLVGGLALVGFPLTSGFFSKDEILHAAFELHPAIGWIALVTALLTAFYTFRMIFAAFHGPRRLPEGIEAHESGAWMRYSLMTLAAATIVSGYTGVSFYYDGYLGLIEPNGMFHRFLAPVFHETFAAVKPGLLHEEAPGGSHVLMHVSGAIAIAGIASAYWLFVARRRRIGDEVLEMPDPMIVLYDKYYVDELYESAIVIPLRRAGEFCYAVDNYVIDGLIWLVTLVPRTAGFLMRELQRGAIQGYALAMTAGVVLMVLLTMLIG